MQEACESWMILTAVSQHFISCFLSNKGKSYIDVHLGQNLLHLCLIFLHLESVYCVETQKPYPCLVIYFVTFIFIQQNNMNIKKMLTTLSAMVVAVTMVMPSASVF